MSEDDKIFNQINRKVAEVLGRQKDNIVVIKSLADFHDYITQVLLIGIVAIDTETDNSTDPLTCQIMGLCLYAPGLKQAYIPVNHRNRYIKERFAWQVTELDIKAELQRVIDAKTAVIMHNGKFDYQVLKCACGICVEPDWDTMIAAQLLNENELIGLKPQYRLHIDPTQQKYDIERLFKGVQYAEVDPDVFALYAATDSLMTYKLYEYQNTLMSTSEKGLYKLFKEIEIPVSIIAAEMELYGARVDLKYVQKLREKYSAKIDSINDKLQICLDGLADVIREWKQTPRAQEKEVIFSKKEEIKKLTQEQYIKKYPLLDDRTGRRYKHGKNSLSSNLAEPIKLSSPKQLGILFYDVFGVRRSRSNDNGKTGSDEIENIAKMFEKIRDDLKKYVSGEESVKDSILKYIDKYSNIFSGNNEADTISNGIKRLNIIIELCDLLLDKRKIDKLISTYLNPVPELVKHWPDGKVRFHLKTLGAATGRFSSGGDWRFLEGGEQIKLAGMNQQALPSENHEIRLMFKAGEGRVFVGGDFSQQEPSVAAFISQDKKMLETFRGGRDVYATIAQAIFNNKYEDNLEFANDEKTVLVDNGNGKKRRKVGKVIILATMYGMSESTVAKRLGKTREEAHDMLDKFYSAFPGLKRAQDGTVKNCKTNGYVTGILGRKRRLPDMQLPHYSVEFAPTSKYKNENAQALLESYRLRVAELNKREDFLLEEEFEILCKEARKNNVLIVSNEDRIRKAQCQCFNARIQGSAATITKETMVLIYNDPIMQECDAHIVFQIHDELIVDCPIDKAEKVKERLTFIMQNSVNALGITLPMKCDPVIEKRWGEGSIPGELRERLNDLKKKGVENPLSVLCAEYPNFPPESIKKVIDDNAEIIEFEW